MYRIGRHASNDFVLKDRAGEEYHCVLYWENGVLWIEDKQSRYGTLVNGNRIVKQALQAGDEIQIGFTRLNWESFLTEKSAAVELKNSYPEPSPPDADSIEAPKIENALTNIPEAEPEPEHKEEIKLPQKFPAALVVQANPYSQNIAPSLAETILNSLPKKETDLAIDTTQLAGTNQTLVAKEQNEQIIYNETLPPLEESPRKKRTLSGDEKIMLTTLAIMLFMLGVGWLWGHWTMG